jgi:hypothetical protein
VRDPGELAAGRHHLPAILQKFVDPLETSHEDYLILSTCLLAASVQAEKPDAFVHFRQYFPQIPLASNR